MAAINIREIPNAPQVGATVLAPTLPGVQPLQPVNLGSGLDGSGVQRARGILSGASDSISQSNDSVARATAATKRNLIDPGPFVAAAGAGQFVGEALQHAGNVATNFADKMMQAKEAMDETRVDAILRNARDQHQLDITQNGISPDQWVPSWNEKQGGVQEQIKALNISPRIRGKVTADVSTFWGAQTNRFALAATTQSISDAGNEAQVNIEQAFKDHDYGVAAHTIQRMVDTKMWSTAKGQDMWNQLQSQQRDDLVNSAIVSNPKAMRDAADTALKDGKPMDGFDWLDASKDAVQVKKVRNLADSQYNDDVSTSFEAGMDSISSGAWTKPEQVQAFADQNDWPVSRTEAAKAFLGRTWSDSPAGQAAVEKQIVTTRDAIANWNPTNDPKQTQRFELEKMISEVPEGRRQGLREAFNDRKEAGTIKPSDSVKAVVTSQVKDMLENRYFGDWTEPKTGEKIPNSENEKKLDAAKKANQLMDNFQEYQKQNPTMSQADGIEWLRTQTAADRQTQKAGATAPSSSWFADPLIPKIPGVFNPMDLIRRSPTQINQQIDQKLGGKPMSGMFSGSGKTMETNTSVPGTVPDETINFIKNQEGFNPKAFSDYAQTSIGYGTRAKPGESSISKEQADARLKSELAGHAVNVDKAIAKSGLELTPNQRAALISFDFNTGAGAHLIETSDSAEEIAARLPTWNKVTEKGKKVVSPGLVNRRAAEMELFNA